MRTVIKILPELSAQKIDNGALQMDANTLKGTERNTKCLFSFQKEIRLLCITKRSIGNKELFGLIINQLKPNLKN